MPIYFVFANPPLTTEVVGIADSDGDGVPDDKDFEDHGNGGVEVSVTSFRGECGNWFGPCKPRFVILLDIDFEGDYDMKEMSGTLTGNDLTAPFKAVFDVPDDLTKVRIEVHIVDDDGGDPIDWTTSSESRWGYVEVVLPLVPRTVEQAGTVIARASVSIDLAAVQI